MTKGFSLLETMVALLILSIGFLGILKMQLVASKTIKNCYYQTQEMILQQSLTHVLSHHPKNAKQFLSRTSKEP